MTLIIEEKKELNEIAADQFRLERFANFMKPIVKNGDWNRVCEAHRYFLEQFEVSRRPYIRAYIQSRTAAIIVNEFFNTPEAMNFVAYHEDWGDHIRDVIVYGDLENAVKELDKRIRDYDANNRSNDTHSA